MITPDGNTLSEVWEVFADAAQDDTQSKLTQEASEFIRTHRTSAQALYYTGVALVWSMMRSKELSNDDRELFLNEVEDELARFRSELGID